ncbi:MAG: presenilin family intramembrane aspartyl protease [Candidatus Anstonellaceae archaeon]
MDFHIFTNFFKFFDRLETKITFMFFVCEVLAFLYLFSLLFFAIFQPNLFQNLVPLETNGDILIAFFLFFYIILVAFLNLLFFKFFRSVLVLKIFEFFSIFLPLSLFLLPSVYILTSDIYFSFFLSFFIGFVITIFRYIFPNLKNILVVISTATIGVLLGLSLGFLPLLIFCILLSIYDYVAVFKTKHMLQLAEMVGSYDLAFSVSFSLPSTSKKSQKTTKPDMLFHPFSKSKPLAKKQFSVSVGSGDFFVPAALLAPVYLEFGKLPLIFLVLFSTFTLYFLLHFTIKHKVALPALPPICLGCFLGIAFGIIIQNIFVSG